jgi:hypothetical protein
MFRMFNKTYLYWEQDSWKHVNFKKAFLPQFRNILREGGRGNACALFPNLLPLISRIPYETTEESIKFHKEFFVFLREGSVIILKFDSNLI